LLLTASAFSAQALLFVPIVPLLIGTGVLASHGEMSFAWSVLALAAGIAGGDLLWYFIGRKRGHAVLGRLCRLALESATCLRRTENLFTRYGAAALLFAKFIPGMSTVALPLAGVFQMRLRRFLRYDLPGTFIWVTAYATAGYLSATTVITAMDVAPVSGAWWLLVGVAALAAYFAWKQVRRRQLLRQLRVARIGVGDLRARLEAGDAVAVIDLRHPLDFESDPYTIPGAVYIPAEKLRQHLRDIPRDRDVVLYCTCPDEITSAKEALRLRQRGIRRVRPLQGGLSAWRDAGYEVERRGPEVPIDERVLNAA
jgi:membrane protein DedA with SNARE-associated domain/rhodanese-related sulfurtransferase